MNIMKHYSKWLALTSFILLIVLVSALYLPLLYRQLFFDDVGKTHLFYSPVTRDFVFTETVVGKVPRQVQAKSEDHHAQLAYKKADQSYVSRAPVFPLMESNPGQARLVFPEDRFRMTENSMEFINADSNKKDDALTRGFTRELKQKGFVFPARSVNGTFTVLKPFDDGIFLVDSRYQVFHVKRVNGAAQVVKTSIDPSIRTRCIKMSENRQKAYYGILLAEDDRVFLISYDEYALICLPLEGYHSDFMDLKLIFNPLYCTAVFSDAAVIHAVVMDKDFEVMDTFSHTMSRAAMTPGKAFYQVLFPFAIEQDQETSDFLSIRLVFSGWMGAFGIALCFFGYGFWCFFVIRKPPTVAKTVLVAMFGIYGIVALNITGMEV